MRKRTIILSSSIAATVISLVFLCLGVTLAAPKTVITFWNSAGPDAQKVYKELIKEYEKENPDIKIDYVYVPWAELRTKLLAAYAGGSGPVMYRMDAVWLPGFAENNMVDPAPPEVVKDIKENFVPILQRYMGHEGTIYGYPETISTHALIYNVDLFKQAGLGKPPKNYIEFREYAKKLAKHDKRGILTQAGMLFNKRLLYLSDFIYNNGANVIGEDEYGIAKDATVNFNKGKAFEAWQLWYDMYNVDKSGSLEFPIYDQSFPQGLVGMVVTVPGFIKTIEVYGGGKINFDVAPLPTQLEKPVVQFAGGAIVINRNAPPKLKEEAWKFNQFLSNSENQIKFCEAILAQITRLSAIKAAANDKRIPAKMRLFNEVLNSTQRVRPLHPLWMEIERIVEPRIEEMLLGKRTAREAADLAASEVNKLFEESRKK